MDGAATVRAYYRTVDEGAYEALAALLAEEFLHERPDRTIEGRDAFVEFMRAGRPDPDTEHALDRVYAGPDEARFAAEGQLVAADGEPYFGFVDTFHLGDDGIRRLRTYTDRHPNGPT